MGQLYEWIGWMVEWTVCVCIHVSVSHEQTRLENEIMYGWVDGCIHALAVQIELMDWT